MKLLDKDLLSLVLKLPKELLLLKLNLMCKASWSENKNGCTETLLTKCLTLLNSLSKQADPLVG